MKWRALRAVKLHHWIPSPPPLAEPLTGLTMGQHGEIMAQKNDISRKDQDSFALASHNKAYEAQKNGIFDREIIPIWPSPRYSDALKKDNIIRADSSLEKLARLPSAFSRPFGTLTAGNSSPLTDGASVTLVADEKRAKALGLKPLAEIGRASCRERV